MPKFFGRRFSRARLFLIFNILFVAAVFVIGFRPDAFRPEIGPDNIAYYNGRRLELGGYVCEEADVDYKNRRLTVCVSGRVKGRVLATTDLYPEYNYGDFIVLTGDLEDPPAIEGFDYGSYLGRYDIYSVMYHPDVARAEGDLLIRQESYLALLRFKWKLKYMIDSNLPEPEAGLANALLLGYRRTVLREDLDIFARVGLSHMIAISGSHITILSAMAINLFLVLGFSRRRALKAVFFFLALYPLMTGLAASAVRSAIMGGLAFLALYNYRVSSLIRVLVFSASSMLAFNPRILRDDIGFQLSFAAVLGIIYLFPFGERWTGKILDRKGWKGGKRNVAKTIMDTINLTLVSQIVILPIALANFEQLSVIAPFSNVLVLWTFPPLLAALIIGLCLTAIMPSLGILWFLPSYMLLKYIFLISGFLARPEWAAVNIAGFNWRKGGLYYLALFVLIRFVGKRRHKNDRAKIL